MAKVKKRITPACDSKALSPRERLTALHASKNYKSFFSDDGVQAEVRMCASSFAGRAD